MEAKEIISAKIISVIEIQITRGTGTENDPVRGVTQYWNAEGQLLAEYDPEKDDFIVIPSKQD
ncbi:MAG: carboxypeptidase [Lachnospiraceae bacterium]|nr:carboxypeptidase [Lachnospiraceae bacterium]